MDTDDNDFQVSRYLLDAKRNAIADCSILYCGRNKPLTASLMGFGWEHGDGWNDAVAHLSYSIEALNLVFYPKWGVRVEAVQVKEKFGTLRFYYEVVTDPPRLVRAITFPFRWLMDVIARKVNFGYHYVMDSSEYTTEEWGEISKEDYDGRQTPLYASNDFGWKFKEEDGKYYRNYQLFHAGKWHMEIRRHRILYAIKNGLGAVVYAVERLFSRAESHRRTVIAHYIDDMASRLVREAEEHCYHTCEECGSTIGSDGRPRCRTAGWIRYVCADCAKRLGDYYDEGGTLHSGTDGAAEPKGEKS